jgi:hypothetical protein
MQAQSQDRILSQEEEQYSDFYGQRKQQVHKSRKTLAWVGAGGLQLQCVPGSGGCHKQDM